MQYDKFPIDFVIPWVDGSDPAWIEEFNKYSPRKKQIEIDNSKERYRDYGLLKYWFRSIEKFVPWVRTVHLITCGQKPSWLNIDCPRLHWVKHSDYIPAEYLPVFSANPIELYMHKIENLAEHFVYFNDDFYITAPVSEDFYFKKGKPCDSAIMEVKTSGINPMLGIIFNNLYCINKNFKMADVIRENFFKWFNVSYGKGNWKNLICIPWKKFPGFINPHMPQPFTKSTFEEVWSLFSEELTRSISNRFRSSSDVNQWLLKHWQICSGNFSPINPYKDKRCFDLKDDNATEIAASIKKSEFKEVVINDSNSIKDFDKAMQILKDAFEQLLPEKSSFEL